MEIRYPANGVHSDGVHSDGVHSIGTFPVSAGGAGWGGLLPTVWEGFGLSLWESRALLRESGKV